MPKAKKKANRKAKKHPTYRVVKTARKTTVTRRPLRVHVVSRGGKWGVMKEDKSRASKLHDKKEDAINHTKRLRNEKGYEIIIHRKDGTVEKWVK